MILLPDEAKLFYRLLFCIQYYVLINTDKTIKEITLEDYRRLSLNKKIKYRNELWSDNRWIDDYINRNTDNLLIEELKIIEKWKDRITDNFLLERILKKYAVFISSESKVYGVIGITDEINEVINQRVLPVYVETVLLPFKDKIIYDGVVSHHSISFGRGMREMFREKYNIAKANNQIILNCNNKI